MLKRYIQHIRSFTLQPSRWKVGVIGMLLLLAAISQAQITTGYIVKGGPDTGSFSGGVLIGTTSKINYAPTEQRILIDEKPGILEGSWKDVTGVNQSTTSLTKTAADGWGNAGAASDSILDTLQNGWIQYKVNNLSDVLAFGLSVSNIDAHYNSIDYAVMINAGQLYVYNQGQLVGNYGAVAVNDSIRIERVGNILFFTRNGILFYNREVDIKQPVMADVALYSQGIAFEMKSSFVDVPHGCQSALHISSAPCVLNNVLHSGEKWFSFTANRTTQTIELHSTTSGHVHTMGFYSGTCSNLNVVDSINVTTANSNILRLNEGNLIVGNTYYIKASKASTCNLCSNSNTEFDLCLRPAPPEIISECGTNTDNIPSTDPSRGVDCSNSGTDWTTKYRTPSHWIPDNNTPVKTILVNIIACRDNLGNNGWQDTPEFRADLDLLFQNINNRYSNVQSKGYALTCEPSVDYITDTRIRFELNELIFLDISAFNILCAYGSGGVIDSYVRANYPNSRKAMNHIFTSPSSYCGHLGYYEINVGNGYVHTKGMWEDFYMNHPDYIGHICHEYGHALGLHHTYDGERTQISNFDFLDDVFGTCPEPSMSDPGHPCFADCGPPNYGLCASTPAPGNITYLPKCFFSGISGAPLMCGGGQGDNTTITYISPKSAGRMHRALSLIGNSFVISNQPMHQYVKEKYSYPVPLEITTNEIWDFKIQLYQDIIVKNGAKLTINCEVRMPINGKIIVERGAQLIIDGGVITTAWDNSLWKGIQVHGYYFASQQIPGDQGKVILKNGALIENAYEGIITIKKDNNGNVDWNYTGGIIQAQNTTFRNCRKAVAFLSYRNFHPITGATLNNLSYFRNCVFETTQQLNDPNANIDDHVSLYDVQGIRFLGCDFSNTAPAGANHGIIQNGIKSIDASYIVSSLCLSTTLPCSSSKSSTFSNLNYGIYATNSNPLLKVTVSNSKFTGNRYDGIHLKGMNYPTVYNCEFNVDDYSQLSSGLYLDNCKYYSIQKNEFYTTTAGGGSVGIWVNDSKNGAHEIYNNTFTGLAAGIVPLNNNSGMFNYTDGLRMNCNTFIGNTYDIGITGSIANNNSVALVQGYTPGTARDLVRNQYSAVCGSENQFFITGSTKQVIHATNSNASTQPLPPLCSDVLVDVQQTSIAFQAADCPDKTLLTNQQRTTFINQLTTDAQVLKTNYNALLDGGNTQQLLNAVNSNMSAGTLKNTLTNKSPYLSDTVMVSYLGKPSPPPPGHIKDVITSNSPVTAKVKSKVDAINLPNGIRQQINNSQTGTSDRLKLEAQIAHTEFNSQLYTADIINSFLNDTLAVNPIDSVIKVLSIYPRPNASKELIQAYIAKGDYVNALTIINSLPTNDFNELQKLIIQVNQAQEKAYSLQTDTTLKNSLEIYANNCNKECCVYAQALLNLVFNTNYPELRMLPQSLRSSELVNEISQESEPQGKLHGLTIYPNPATDELNIVFNDSTITSGTVEIHDLIGRLIEQVTLKVNEPYNYNTSLLPRSIYSVSLYVDDKLIENKKLVLIK